ncbi:hypothetical protein [Streptomyces sp. NBC_01451]|uniref:hypothetical protein n=1 Tax=Streptomyces sp. NBC_01451 TaxID=2903872 RepID=UPI002E36E5DA|nr:hypothetical protein [Streptomyces sp. NBC_01451]
MPRTVVRRRFPHRAPARTAVAAAVAVAVALLVTACSADPRRSEGTSPVSVAPAHLSHTLPDDPVRMVLPADGAEARWTQGLDVFGQQVARATADSCARRLGFRLPQQIPVVFIRFFEVPDLDFITRHGLSASAEVPTPAVSDAPARTGSEAETSRCQKEGAAAVSALRATYVPLQGAWFDELAALRRAPATARVLRQLPACFSRQGFRVPDEMSFMGLGDARKQAASAAELPSIEVEMGRAYATCMRPVEAVREPARLNLRTEFLTEHATQIRELRSVLVPLLHRAEKQHGVRLAFPAP